VPILRSGNVAQVRHQPLDPLQAIAGYEARMREYGFAGE
jgi:hypothetical protein